MRARRDGVAEERDQVLRAGAVGLLEKGGPIEALASAIRGAAVTRDAG